MNCRGLAFALLTATALADEPSPEAVACYEWFGTLGFPDIRQAAFADYTDGGWSDFGHGPKQPQRHGFVLENSEETFRVLTPELDDYKLAKTKGDVPDHERVAWTETAFSDYVRALLHELQHPGEEADRASRRFGERLSHPTEIFGVAYAAWRRGLPALSQDLFAEALKTASVPPAGLRARLEQDLGHAAMWRAVVAFGHGAGWDHERKLVSRKELLTMFENIIRRYPASDHVPRARETADMLKAMIAEDEAHPTVMDEALEKLPVGARVEELIFRLRNQNGHQWGQPGFCDIFDGEEAGTTAAHRLVEIGLDAVPALIPALSDKRFCRSVGYHRNFYFSHSVLTIGDCALAVLQRVAGRGFYEHSTSSSYMSGEDKEAPTRKAVEAWWAEVQKKGIRQVLAEQLSSGELHPRAIHGKLAALDANAAASALLEGAAKARSQWPASAYFDLLGSSSDPRAEEFLLQRMREGESRASRVAAISALADSKRRGEVLPALLREWRALGSGAVEADDRDTFEAMVSLLSNWRTPESIAALGIEWERRSASQRAEICEELANALGPDGSGENPETKLPVPPDATAAAERILVRALADIGSKVSMGGSFGDWHFSSPAVSTIANWALHQLKPDAYAFSNKASRQERETERIAAMNTWRRAQGEPLVRAPPARPALPPGQAMQIVDVVIDAPRGKSGQRLRDAATKLKGTKFEPDTLTTLCRGFASRNTPGISGMVAEAVRNEDLTGVTITLRLTAGTYPGEDGKWSQDSHINLGEEALLDSFGSSARQYIGETGGWKNELKQLRKIIEAPPDAAFDVRFCVGDTR